MAHRVLITLLLCLCCSLMQAKQREDQLFNYGVKGGFCSTIYEVRELTIASMPINAHMAKSEISSFYTFLMRFNMKRHYLQTEASYNISNYTLEFASDQWNHAAMPYDKSIISTQIIGVEVPLYYGYHILHEGPYGMSLFFGPKAKFILMDYSQHHFENIPYTYVIENISPFNFSLTAGLGINISRVYFDFSFEYGLHNISKGFTTIDIKGNESSQDMAFNRRKNVLSFSIGVIL